MKTTLTNRSLVLLLTGASLLFTNCSSLTHSKNDVAVGKVRKVALVGFTVVTPTPAKIGVDIASGKTHGMAGGSLIPKQADEISEMYLDLLKSFSKNLSWQAIALPKLKQNAAYKSAFDRTMKGWQNKMPPGQGQQQYLVDGVMDNDGLRILGTEGRDALIRGLGVDAVITAQVDVLLSATTVMGIGNRYPQSRLSFRLYTIGSQSPDWFEGNIEGEVSKTSVGKTAFFDEKTLTKAALESAKTAFAQIGKTK